MTVLRYASAALQVRSGAADVVYQTPPLSHPPAASASLQHHVCHPL